MFTVTLVGMEKGMNGDGLGPPTRTGGRTLSVTMLGILGMSGIRILGVLLPGLLGAGPLLLGRHGHGALGMKGQGLHTTCHQWPMRKHITMGTPAHWAGGTAGRDAW